LGKKKANDLLCVYLREGLAEKFRTAALDKIKAVDGVVAVNYNPADDGGKNRLYRATMAKGADELDILTDVFNIKDVVGIKLGTPDGWLNPPKLH